LSRFFSIDPPPVQHDAAVDDVRPTAPAACRSSATRTASTITFTGFGQRLAISSS
jgi:hypothetical protein